MEYSDLLPVLVHVQANLEQELSLEDLATLAGRSPAHFQREFKAIVGESPREYVERLRLERASWRLLLHDLSVLEISLECGYQNHETFTRAFQRRYGCSPSEHRERGLNGGTHSASRTGREGMEFQLSQPRLVRLRETHIAFIRQLGPYENVSDTMWQRLSEWALARGIEVPHILVGVGHDAPQFTPPEKLRFDAGLRVNHAFEAEGDIASQVLPGGDFALTTHVGAYTTLPQAYPQMFGAIARIPDTRIVGLPVIEVYHTTQVVADHEVKETNIYIPVKRV